jgi:hypothetical protein
VPARGVIQSPVLIGRDAYLPLIERRLAGAAEGEGRLPFVAGEAGIGPVRSAGRGWRNGAVAGQPGGMARSSAGSRPRSCRLPGSSDLIAAGPQPDAMS